DLREGLIGLFQNGTTQIKIDVLLQKADPYILFQGQGAPVQGHLPGQKLEQGGFPSPVLANKTDSVPCVKAKGDFLKKIFPPKGYGELMDIDHRVMEICKPIGDLFVILHKNRCKCSKKEANSTAF